MYIEAIGGTGALLPDGRHSLLLTNTSDGTFYAKGATSTGQYGSGSPVFEEYKALQTPDASNKIEVRLHYWATQFRNYDKLWQEATYFDDITLQ